MTRDYVQKPSEELVELARQAAVRTKNFYLATSIEGGVLSISIWKQLTLLHNGILAKPDGVYWIDRGRKTWRGYWNGPQGPKRSRAMFFNYLCIGLDDDWRYCRDISICMSKEEKDTVRKFFAGGPYLPDTLINTWQEKVMAEKRQESYDRKFSRIDGVMESFPPLPDDWDDWLKDTVFAQSRYIFYRTEGKKSQTYRCEVCGQTGKVEKQFRHNEVSKCPACGARVIAKGWKRQKYIDSSHDVVIYLKNAEGRLCARKFWVKKTMRQKCALLEDIWESAITCNENRREIFGANMVRADAYEMGTHIPTGDYRWLDADSKYDWRSTRIVYDKNLTDMLGDLPQVANVDLLDLFAAGQGIEVKHEKIITNLIGFAQVEYLQKMGLMRMAREAAEMGKDYWLFDKDGQTAEEFLHLDRKHVDMLKKMDGGVNEMHIMQNILRVNGNLDEDSIRWCMSIGADPTHMMTEKTGMSLQRMVNYTRKQLKLTGMKYKDWIQMYEDYLSMAQKRGMDIHDDIVCHNSQMCRFHDMYAADDAQRELAGEIRKKDKRFKKISKDAKKNNEHFGYEKNEYVITSASSAGDIVKEGRRQHHCVAASDNYLKKMSDRETFICFLRKKDNPETPYYTLEVKWNGHVEQAYGAYDRRPDWSKVEKLLRSFSSEIKKRCQEEEARKRTVVGQEAYARLLIAAG